MNKKDIIKQLQKESKNIVPDVKAQVFQSLGLNSSTEKKSIFKPRLALISFASTFIMLIVALFYLLPDKTSVNSYVTVDINPSVELIIDKKDLVVESRPLNLDGVLVLEEKDVKGLNVNEAITSIIETANKLGYLTNDGEVNIQAINDNQKVEDAIINKIKNHFQDKINVKVNEITDEIRKEAKENDISAGRMKLIKNVIEKNPEITVKEAKKLSVKELNDLLRSNDEKKNQQFQEEYKKKAQELSGYRKKAEDAYMNFYDNAIARINNIKSKIDQGEKLKQVIRLINLFLNDYFPEYNEEIPSDIDGCKQLLTNLENSLNEEKALALELFYIKFNIQLKYYQKKIKNEANSTFNFTGDFSIKEIRGKNYNSKEKQILTLIEEMETMMELEKGNEKIKNDIASDFDKLAKDYEEIITSQEISEEFKENKIVKEFADKYQEYKKNK